jgi:pimeloyl-ACP methyl ester carboxylesterase
MPTFSHGPVEIAYLDEGQGDPIILIHGFASSKDVNWVQTGWFTALKGAGRRVIALDNRGHGQSAKLYNPDDYHTTRMASDAKALMAHLGITRADVMGYSMGARITAFLALQSPELTRSIVLGGLGIHLVEGVGLPESIADAMEAPSLAGVTDPQGYTFRAFADKTKSDRRALAACIRGSRQELSREQVGSIRTPTLVAIGTRDLVAGSPDRLVALMPNARALPIPDRDHMIAVGDKVYKTGVLQFLAERA